MAIVTGILISKHRLLLKWCNITDNSAIFSYMLSVQRLIVKNIIPKIPCGVEGT